jgi:hypothetical protein
MESADLAVPGTDAAAYAAYRVRVSAEAIEPELADAVGAAIAPYGAERPE